MEAEMQYGSQSPGVQKKKFSKIYILLPLIHPSHISLALFPLLYLELLCFYSVHAHITSVYRGFLPGLLPPSKANLCSLRGGKAWQVRTTKMDVLNATLHTLQSLTRTQVPYVEDPWCDVTNGKRDNLTGRNFFSITWITRSLSKILIEQNYSRRPNPKISELFFQNMFCDKIQDTIQLKKWFCPNK